jgi:hypothetical protein
MKRKNDSNRFLGLILFFMLVLAVLIASLVFNMIIKNSNVKEESSKPEKNAVDVVNKNETKGPIKYIAVQGGIFSVSENAEKAKGNLSAYGNPFTVQEEKGTRVFLGIYKEEEGLNVMKLLSNNKIDNSKMIFEIDISSDACDGEIVAVISAELDILAKLSDKNIKSIQTEELKKWASSLSEVDKNSKNITLLSEIKSNINNLPKELDKSKVQEQYTFIYSALKKLTVK